jgi:hypothetical protein
LLFLFFLNIAGVYLIIEANVPTTAINTIRPINEMTSPAITNPLGALNTPTNDKISLIGRSTHSVAK